MRAIVVSKAGGPESLTLTEVAEPQPSHGEVTIAVKFAGVGFVDTLFRRNVFGFRLPLTPGIEVAGTIRSVGPNVENLTIGQNVAAFLNDFVHLPGLGGYAEVARARAALTVPVPENVDLSEAAAVLVNGTTAWMAIHDVARLQSGESVLVTGASGGLGSMVGILARKSHARRILGIVGTASKREHALASGFDAVISGSEPSLNEPIDAAFDTTGGVSRRIAFEHLAPLGRLVILGNASGDDASFSGDAIWLGTKAIAGLNVGGIAHVEPGRVAAAAQRVLALVAADAFDAKPTEIMPLAAAADAHRLLEERKISGKIVLDVSA